MSMSRTQNRSYNSAYNAAGPGGSNKASNAQAMNIHGTSSHFPLLCSLDIGTSSIKIIMARINPINSSSTGATFSPTQIDVIGVGVCPNSGLKNGVVVNIEATTECIRKAKEEAELMSGIKANEVWVSVSGSHIQSLDSRGMVAIKNKEVTAQDIERVIEGAKAIQIPVDRTVLHVIPREYKVDHQDGIIDPIGMSGVRLEANVHIVTASQSALSNLTKCIEKSGLKVSGYVLDQVANIRSVISSDEKSLGVCCVDIGAASSKLVYVVNGGQVLTAHVPVGGQHFTQDVAIGLRTPQVFAETLKKKYGCALASLVGDQDTVEVEGVGGRKSRTVARKELATILEARAEECLNLIANNIRLSGLHPLLGSGIVLTGGASQLDGLAEMGEFVFDLPVRKGSPVGVGGLKDVVKGAEFTTSLGLLLYAIENTKVLEMSFMANPFGSGIGSMTGRVKKFFSDLF
jgi:cell division protein FtsA